MTRVSLCDSSRLCRALFLALLAVIACTDKAPPSGPLSPAIALAVGGTQGPTVKSTTPDSAEVGTTLDVRVLGSGFDAGSRANWAFKGVVSEKIVTNSTRFVSSRELVANITIARDANLGKHDVIVTTSSGKGGIGTELFEVTLQIIDLGGLSDGESFAYAVNASGVVIGQAVTARYGGVAHAARWTMMDGRPALEDLTPLLQLPATETSSANGINDHGSIVGFTIPVRTPTIAYANAFLLLESGQFVNLHESPFCSGESDGKNYSRATDINNLGEVVGSRQFVPNPGSTTSRAFYWAAGCLTELPTLGARGHAMSINDNSVIVGESMDASNVQWAVKWEKVGSEWTISKLGRASSYMSAINDLGTAVGNYGTTQNRRAVYWTSAGSEEELGTLGGGQSDAWGIDGSGRIVGSSQTTKQSRPFDWTPSQGMRDLGSLGGRDAYGLAQAVNGRFIVGNSLLNPRARDLTRHATLWILP